MIKKRGFTLIELLVVVATIGILTTIVVTGINKAREKTYIAKFSSNLKSFQNALEMYYIDHGEYPEPPIDAYTYYGSRNHWNIPSESGEVYTYLKQELESYIDLDNIFLDRSTNDFTWFYYTTIKNKNTLVDSCRSNKNSKQDYVISLISAVKNNGDYVSAYSDLSGKGLKGILPNYYLYSRNGGSNTRVSYHCVRKPN